MAKIEPDLVEPGQPHGIEHQLLNFDIGFQPRVTVELGAYLNLLARRVESARPGMQHTARVTKPRNALPIQQMRIDARHLGCRIGSESQRATR